MILVGNSRGGAKDLALHLMKEENEHVEVFEIRGFVARDLMGALNEAYAVSRGTKCEKFLYSCSFNPPPGKSVPVAEFIRDIDKAEKTLGLKGHARVIVFHEKEGPGGMRRHAHAVWSRIDGETMKAQRMSFDRMRLMNLSRELFICHGWNVPDGLLNRENRNPKNFTLADWQQAKRSGKDARAVKTDIQNAWAVSDSKAAFAHALEERGYRLARGDRRSFVAVDVFGEVYSIPRMAGVKTKAAREKLGDKEKLPSIEKAKAQIAHEMISACGRFRKELSASEKEKRRDYERRRIALVAQQRAERKALRETQAQRRIAENLARQSRFRTGIKGLWDRLRGEYARIRTLNEREALEAKSRDRGELDQISFRHMGERRQIEIYKYKLSENYTRQRDELARQRKEYEVMRSGYSRDGPEM